MLSDISSYLSDLGNIYLVSNDYCLKYNRYQYYRYFIDNIDKYSEYFDIYTFRLSDIDLDYIESHIEEMGLSSFNILECDIVSSAEKIKRKTGLDSISVYKLKKGAHILDLPIDLLNHIVQKISDNPTMERDRYETILEMIEEHKEKKRLEEIIKLLVLKNLELKEHIQ